MLKLLINRKSQRVGLLLAVEHVKSRVKINAQLGDATALDLGSDVTITSAASVCRYLARVTPDFKLYGATLLEQAEVDYWLEFGTVTLQRAGDFHDALQYLDNVLATITFLVGHSLTIADFVVWGALRESCEFCNLFSQKKAPLNVSRYYKFLAIQPEFTSVDAMLPATPKITEDESSQGGSKERKQEGKFIDLPGAEMGKVVVRFPPEASGYLHVGHAKAALLNQYYQQAFNGKLIMRFDDTNPAKENAEFEKVILDDIALLGIKPDVYTFTSDHFDRLLQFCTQMIQEGNAYVDDTDPETMKKEREERTESKNRNNTIEKNLSMWEEMKKGSELGQRCCVRAKIDMQSDNGCLRDPTLYRCKLESHVKTGDKYKTYPTYDFACPIVDSVEGVTHALRTMEYHDRDDQYYWILRALKLREPYLWEYSRLNLQNTVMSKRKLTWFVDSGLIPGWDDPRFPTVRGVMRRGMTVEGLKEFVVAQGSSRSINMMDWDKIWAFNKKVIDPIVPRFTTITQEDAVPVSVIGATTEVKDVQKHPKDPSVGYKPVWYSSRVYIEAADAAEFSVGENVTFINWGNLIIKKIVKSPTGKITEIEATLNLENTDFKKTQKITWLAETTNAPFTPTICVHFDHIITKAILGKDEDFKQFINPNSRVDTVMLGDPELANLKKGDMIQIQRKGYFICDEPFQPASRYSGRESPCILFNIPDGHTKDMPTTGSKHKGKEAPSAKEQAQTQRGKSAEKSPQTEVSPSPIAGSKLDSGVINQAINDQGNKIRQLKADKVDKAVIDKEVKVLQQLKEDYKSATGLVWKPDAAPATSAAAASLNAQKTEPVTSNVPPLASGVETPEQLASKIDAQGVVVRDLKAKKAAKSDIDIQVKTLLSLKADYKKLAGKEYVPGAVKPTEVEVKAMAANLSTIVSPAAAGETAEQLAAKIEAQGGVVRDLKASKAPKADIEAQVKTLLALKADYKKLTGQDYAPGKSPATAAAAAATPEKSKPADTKKQEQSGGGKKEQGGKKDADKKQEKGKKGVAEVKVEEKTAAEQGADAASREVKKVTRLGMEVKKDENFPEWYSQVITKSEMIEYYDVSGCYVLRPWAFGIWEMISKWFDAEIKKIGFENCYFPMFVSQAALETEKEHVEDFAPEVAWVTRSGTTELAEPIAIRPTSETVMYPSYAKWVQSHRDLPIKINQWCNVVRWEFKHPQPFLRTREFLWQEGHSAYATYDEAEKEVGLEKEVYYIIDLYENIYENLLAIPVIKGKKTQKEKFAGADYTTTVEAYISATGRGIQAATSHHLGQNFSKMFNISFEDPDSHERRFAYQNSWAITTRSIGIIVMVHGDDKGLVLPPRIAQIQVVVIPCGVTAQLSEADKKQLISRCEDLVKSLQDSGVRVRGDYRDNYSPGWKFNHWELKGVPVRVEIGPRDIQNKEFVAVRRDNGAKLTLKLNGAVDSVKKLLEDVQTSMFAKAKKEMEGNVAVCHGFDEFCASLDKLKVIMAPFCGAIKCEEQIKKLSARDAITEDGAPAMGAKGLCIPFKQPAAIKDTDKCILPGCTGKPQYYTLFGRSY